MIGFAELQSDFQRAIVEGDEKGLEALLARIPDGPREKRDVLFSVYRNAYVLRLVEAMRNDNAVLHAFLGDEQFDDMARAYVAARPSTTPNMRWFCKGLPEFLRETEPFRDYPVVGEIAALEAALADAFDAHDSNVLALTDFAGVAVEAWRGLTFEAHPSARRLDLATNASDIWSALTDGQDAPDPQTLDEPERLIVWRQDTTAMVRAMSTEEAMLWDEAGGGLPFGVLCEMAATYDDPDNAAGRVAGYLHGWVSVGMLSGFSGAA